MQIVCVVYRHIFPYFMYVFYIVILYFNFVYITTKKERNKVLLLCHNLTQAEHIFLPRLHIHFFSDYFYQCANEYKKKVE